MAFDVPILFIVFNRPDTTVKVFERIREQKPQQLFVAADGPRTSREGEKEKCEAVRKLIMDGIDWDCKVQTKFSDVNLGCGTAESSAMIWFFKAIGEGIVLEDDTLPDPTFFTFCKELLSYYRNDESIRMIGGNNFQNGQQRGDGSYYFSNITHSWGYASWWRAWADYDFELTSISENDLKRITERVFQSQDEKDYWITIYQKLKSKVYDTWDFQFLFKMWQKGGKCIIPNKNIVTNIGFGNNATHTTNADDDGANRPLGQIQFIAHPKALEISYEADRYFFKSYLQGTSSWKRRIRKLISILKKSV